MCVTSQDYSKSSRLRPPFSYPHAVWRARVGRVSQPTDDLSSTRHPTREGPLTSAGTHDDEGFTQVARNERCGTVDCRPELGRRLPGASMGGRDTQRAMNEFSMWDPVVRGRSWHQYILLIRLRHVYDIHREAGDAKAHVALAHSKEIDENYGRIPADATSGGLVGPIS